MFEAMEKVLIEFIQYIPYLMGVWVIFDLTGSLLFNRR